MRVGTKHLDKIGSAPLFQRDDVAAGSRRAPDPLSPRFETTGDRRLERARWIVPFVAAIGGLVAVLALDVFMIPADGQMAVIFPSKIDDNQAFLAIAAAGGSPIRLEQSAFGGHIWVAKADAPNFRTAVLRYGALMTVNPYAFGGCLLSRNRTVTS